MSKFSEQFEHTVVQQYVSGGGGYRALSQRHGMANRSLVERWVAACQLHGNAGLSKKRSRYDADFKLSVLQHMWENRLSITQTAAKFDIRRHSTVGNWERLPHRQLSGAAPHAGVRPSASCVAPLSYARAAILRLIA